MLCAKMRSQSNLITHTIGFQKSNGADFSASGHVEQIYSFRIRRFAFHFLETESTNLLLKFHSCFASCSFLAQALGFISLQSKKYFPLTPFRLGWSATQHDVAAPYMGTWRRKVRKRKRKRECFLVVKKRRLVLPEVHFSTENMKTTSKFLHFKD